MATRRRKYKIYKKSKSRKRNLNNIPMIRNNKKDQKTRSLRRKRFIIKRYSKKQISWTNINYTRNRDQLQNNLYLLIKRPSLKNIDPYYETKDLSIDEAKYLYKYINEFINSNASTWNNKKPLYDYLTQIKFNRFLYIYEHVNDITSNLKLKSKIKQIFHAAFNTHIKKIGNINSSINKDGDTLLMYTSYKDYYYLTDMLLRRPDVNINKQNHNDDTALIIASWEGNTEIVRLLVRRPRVDKTITNYNGDSAMTLARSRRHQEIVQILR